MKLAFTSTDIADLMKSERHAMGRAVTRALATAGVEAKLDWRARVVAGGLGVKMGNTVRSKIFPRAGFSYTPATEIYSTAETIMSAHEQGALIRSSDGFFLSIPLPAAGLGSRGKHITPGEWEKRRGIRLRFVFRRGKTSLLVADTARINTKGLGVQKRGKVRRDGILTGAASVPIFILVPQVRLKKKFDINEIAERAAGRVAGLIQANWA